MKKRIVLFVVIILIVSLCCVLSASAYTSQQASATQPWCGYVLTSGSNLQVRICPTTNCEIVYSLPYGSPIQIIGQVAAEGGTWYRVEYDFDGSTGYVSAEYITAVSKQYGTAIAPSGLNFRDEETLTSLALVPYGHSLPVAGGTNDWHIVVWGSSDGYVSRTYFTT